jgi:hypothetical protein
MEDSPSQAFNTIYQLEISCRSQVDAMAARTELTMPGENVLAHTAHLCQPGTRRPYGILEWPAMLRLLAAQQRSRDAGQQAMVAHDHRVVPAEIANEPLALVDLDRRTFVVVVADVADEADRGLRQRQQSASHRRHRHAGARMCVQHAGDIRPSSMNGAVDDVAGNVDAVISSGLVMILPSTSILTRLDAVISL